MVGTVCPGESVSVDMRVGDGDPVAVLGKVVKADDGIVDNGGGMVYEVGIPKRAIR